MKVHTGRSKDYKTAKRPGSRWSVERANRWHARYPWICGCNYVPATAVNQLEMWQADTFDPKTIDRELGMAEAIGLNTVRIFLKMIAMTSSFGRPVICTEYIARPTNNFFNVTPVLKKANVGAIHFGLVNGKCNFQFYSPKDLPEPKHWKHDIFRSDGTPFDPKEIEQIKKLTGKKK